jgi:mannitol/fructose-specific phosphotransferase system IIA component (Ntr-type)
MPKMPDPRETANLQELLMAQMIQIDTISNLLIEKGLITQEEFFKKLKAVKAEYESKKRRSM